ncbi:MAG: DNA-binding protein [Planctomycetota bacterium]|nr:DNA-binding protein [Planctomycetota bacterium]
MIPKLIQTDAENQAALARLDEIFDAKPGTPDGEEFELLVALIEAYERVAYPIDLPDPIEAIRFRMEQAELTAKDLIPFIGNNDKASEILSVKRPMSIAMIRRLESGLGIPAEVLLQQPGGKLSSADTSDYAKQDDPDILNDSEAEDA